MARTRDNPSLRNKPTLALIAMPLRDTEAKSLFSEKPGSLRRLLENPPSLRPHGWSLDTGAIAHAIEGKHLRVESRRSVIDLYRDGTLVFAGLVTKDYLAWGHSERFHPLALIEVILSFCNFF